MKAAWYETLGDAGQVLQVGETENPNVAAGQVRVRVQASGVNPSDVKQRSGWGGLKMRYPRVVPHNDGAGVIEAIGDGVECYAVGAAGRAVAVGDRVWIYEATLTSGQGTAAEFVVVPVEKIVPLPDNTSFVEGACLGVPAMTAHHCVFKDGTVKGKMVLVTGGAGAVGNYAIQLAKWGGATVITTVSSEEKAAIARTAGADHLINYKTEDVAEKVKQITNGQGCDRVIEVDFGANLASNLKILKVDGVIATYASDAEREPNVPVYSLMYKNLTVHYVLVYAMSSAAHKAAADDISQCLQQGALHHVIAETFNLEQIAEAHKRMESGKAIGNLVIEF